MNREMDDNGKPLDQILYEAYCESTGWKSAVTGSPLPHYHQCPPAVVLGWQAVADAAIEWADEWESEQFRGDTRKD